MEGGRGKEAHLEVFVGVEMQDLELFERAGQLGDAARGQAAHQRDQILRGLECSTSVASLPKDERAAVCSRLPSAAGRGRLSAYHPAGGEGLRRSLHLRWGGIGVGRHISNVREGGGESELGEELA